MSNRTRRWLAPLLILGLLAGVTVTWVAFRSPPPDRAASAIYQCAMHPQIVSNEPGTCPICGMRLERVTAHAPSEQPTERRIVGYRHPMRPDVTSPVPAKDEMGMDYTPIYADEVGHPASDVPDHAPFVLSTERQQLIGVRRGVVERRPLAVQIRAAGRVAYDPTLYQTLVEYRESLRVRREIAGSHLPEAHRSADALVAAARLKLRQKGVSEAELAAGSDPTNLLLPGNAAWIYVQLYESEMGLVHPGQRIAVTIPSVPGAVYDAEVVAVDPILDPTTRSLRVRARIAKPDARLHPEAFVHATVEIPLGDRLAVPSDAVVNTGERTIVFVVHGDGEFEPRSVRLGRRAGEWIEVLDGVAEGDVVVTSANFLIDSESRIRSALRSFTPTAGSVQ